MTNSQIELMEKLGKEMYKRNPKIIRSRKDIPLKAAPGLGLLGGAGLGSYTGARIGSKAGAGGAALGAGLGGFAGMIGGALAGGMAQKGAMKLQGKRFPKYKQSHVSKFNKEYNAAFAKTKGLNRDRRHAETMKMISPQSRAVGKVLIG